MTFLFSRRGLAAILVVALLAFGAARVSISLQNARERLDTASELAAVIVEKAKDLRKLPPDLTVADSLEMDLLEAQRQLLEIRQGLGWLLTIAPYFSWLPTVGGDLGALDPLLDAGLDTVDAGRLALAGANQAIGSLPSLISTENREGNFLEDTLEPIRQELQDALRLLTRAEDSLNEVDLTRLRPGLLTLAERLRSAIDQARPVVQQGLDLSDLAARLLGSGGEARYLIVAQNADELRATGGFIPGAWLLRLKNGRMESLVFYDSPDVDDLTQQYPAPPEWLGKSLWGGIWVFRDAFWFPHFPASAQAAEELFLLGQGIEVDGVIAFNQWLVPSLVEAMGPITIPGLDKPLTHDDVLDVMRRETDQQGRAYIDLIMKEMLRHLREDVDRQTAVNILSAISRMPDEKHILVYLHDPEARAKIRDRTWDGALRDQAGDYLMVVDSNVGYNKVNASVAESIDYRVFIDHAGGALGQVTIDYENRSQGFSPQCIQGSRMYISTYEELSQGCYWDYLRVYLPLRATPVAWPSLPLPPGSLYAQGDPLHDPDTFRVYTEVGKTVLGGFFTIPQRGKRVLVFAYKLPGDVLKRDGQYWEYSLVVQKQPGTLGHPFHLSVSYPEDWELQDPVIAPSYSQPGLVEFQASLTRDFILTLRFRPS